MCNQRRRRFLVFGGSIGLTTLAGCQGIVSEPSGGGTNRTDSSDGTNYLGALSKGSPGEFSNLDDGRSGWVHTVAHGETYGVTFDARICHDAGDEVKVELSEQVSGEYTLSFTTGGGTHGGSGCNFGTRVNGGGSIPTDFQSLNVDVNGETLETVQREGTMASLQPLPDPIDAR